MKKKGKKKQIGMIGSTIVILVIGMFVFKSSTNEATTDSGTSSQIVEVAVTSKTIQNTLTSSGEIVSASTEKLSLSTSKYFSVMCIEEDDTVLKGENILKYTNGTYLTAPYDCVVTSYEVPETGKNCSSSHYVEIQTLETMQMTLNVDESESNRVKVGQSVSIVLAADETKEYEGSITKMNAIGNYSTSGSTFTATIQFTNDQTAKIGMSASCTVVLEEAVDCIAVPVAAVQTKDNEKYVIVVKEDGTTEDVTVKTGISDDSYVQILSGLTGDETVQMLQTTSSTGIRNASKNSSISSSSGFGGMQEQMGGGFTGGQGGPIGEGQMPMQDRK